MQTGFRSRLAGGSIHTLLPCGVRLCHQAFNLEQRRELQAHGSRELKDAAVNSLVVEKKRVSY